MTNDDSIANEGYQVRNFMSNDHYLQERLLDVISCADLSVPQDKTLRELVNKILYRVYQVDQDLKPLFEEVYQKHESKI